MSGTSISIDHVRRRVEITRRFAASPDRVWRLWTDPSQISQWWAPAEAGLRVTRCDIRPGGLVEFADGGSDGSVRARWRIHDTDAPRRLHFSFEDARLPPVEVTVASRPETGETTLVTITLDLPSSEALQTILAIGFDQALERALLRAGQLTDSSSP